MLWVRGAGGSSKTHREVGVESRDRWWWPGSDRCLRRWTVVVTFWSYFKGKTDGFVDVIVREEKELRITPKIFAWATGKTML